MRTSTLKGILHQPYGLEHPYEQEPAERFPRDPIAGQPVSVGALTWPAGAAAAVWAAWHTEPRGESGEAQGECVGDHAAATHWRVALPSVQACTRVSYQLHARQGEVHVSSGVHSFYVPDWCRLDEMTGYRLLPGGVECKIGGPGLEGIVTFEFPRPHLLHMRLCAWAPGEPSEPQPSGSPREGSEEPIHRLVEETPAQIVIATEAMELRLQRRPYRMEVRRSDGLPLLDEAEPPSWLVGEGGRALAVRQVFISPEEEAFYGFGERFNGLDQRGHSLDIRVYDQYKRQDRRTYLPVPFLLSSTGYGLILRTSRRTEYDLAASEQRRWFYRAEVGAEAALESDLIVANHPKDILTTYAGLIGKPSLPPIWAFGPWMSGNEWNSQATVMEQVEKTIENAIPATVLVIEAWSDESTFYIWNDARYSPKPPALPFALGEFTFPSEGKWPDPKGMIDALHRLGIRVILWQIPVMKRLEAEHTQRDADEAYMVEKRYCVQEADGEPYRIRPGWFQGSLVLDCTHPEAVEWWLSKRAYLLDEMGVDGFKTDGGEHLWGKGLRLADGRRGDEICNLYPNLYVGAYHRFAKQKRAGDAITFSRAGFAGSQSFPLHWAGDEDSTWEAYRASVLAGQNAGMSGIPFWGWDLGGFGGETPSAELYLRAAAMAAFCPIMQYHSEYNEHRLPCRDRTPWNIEERTGDGDVTSVFGMFARLRMNLLPYIYSEAWKSAETGIPLMRPLVLEFPEDRYCREYPYQYLFGGSLLVAPIVEPGRQSWPVYLPAGTWYDLWTGEMVEGPGRIERLAPKDAIPVFVRGGTILPLNLGEDCALPGDVGNAVDHYRNLCFRLYPHHAEGRARQDWYDSVSASCFPLEQEVSSDGVRTLIGMPPIDHNYCLTIIGSSPSIVVVNGRELGRARSMRLWRDSRGQGWCLDPKRRVAWVRLEGSIDRSVIELV